MEKMKKKKKIIKDENIWDEYVKDIDKISSSGKVEPIQNKEVIFKESCSEDFINYVGESSAMLDELKKGDFKNIDGNLADKFRKGKMSIEAKLDLHGYTQDKAYDRLINFVLSCYSNQKRCLIVITGKGSSKTPENFWEERTGKLKELVPTWLNSDKLRPYILTFATAQQKDGGSGALYVLLKKNK